MTPKLLVQECKEKQFVVRISNFNYLLIIFPFNKLKELRKNIKAKQTLLFDEWFTKKNVLLFIKAECDPDIFHWFSTLIRFWFPLRHAEKRSRSFWLQMQSLGRKQYNPSHSSKHRNLRHSMTSRYSNLRESSFFSGEELMMFWKSSLFTLFSFLSLSLLFFL